MSSPALHLPAVMGHRGAAGLAPENTLAGFRRAAALGVTWVELDVRLTADGVALLSHDESLTRATGLRRKIGHVRYVDIARLDAGAWFDPAFRGESLPTLVQALDLLAQLKIGVNIELKRHIGQEERVVHTVAAALAAAWSTALPPPLMSSFDPAMVAAAKRVLPGLPRALIADRLPRNWQTLAGSLACFSLHLNWRSASKERVLALHEAGYAVGVYTVNDPTVAHELWSRGVDCIITDRPDLMLAACVAAEVRR